MVPLLPPLFDVSERASAAEAVSPDLALSPPSMLLICDSRLRWFGAMSKIRFTCNADVRFEQFLFSGMNINECRNKMARRRGDFFLLFKIIVKMFETVTKQTLARAGARTLDR